MSDKLSFLTELKRRHVVRAAIIYAAAVWALAQGISQLSPAFGLSERVTLWFVIACAVGFPFWLAFAWYFKFTAHGIERESQVMESKVAIRHTNRRLGYWIIGIMAVAIVLLLTNELVLQRGKTMREFADAPTAVTSVFNPPADSIVVLPFTNLSGDPTQQYFINGVTEELTNALGESTDLTVIAWETASKYVGGEQTPAGIGKALNVANILGGSIEHEGSAVRVSVELVSTVTGRQLWSAHYDDTLQNIFAVQDKISAAIAGALKVKFAAMQAAPTLNPQAHKLYLRGLAAMNRFTAADAQAAQNDFRQALKFDPNYADAWAGLATSYLRLAEVSTLPLKEAQSELRAAAGKALALDPRNVNALVELANADRDDNRIDEAKAEYQQALAFDPSNVAAHLDFGVVLPLRAGLAQTQEAARLDPDNAVAQNNLVGYYQDLADWPRMVAASEALNRLSPHDVDVAFTLAFAYVKMQRDEEAIKAFDLVQPATAMDRQLVEAGRLTYRALLEPARRPKVLATLDSLRRAHLSPNSQGDLLQLYLALDQKKDALNMILSGYCSGDPVGCNDLSINPLYAPLHGDPRFEKLAKQYTTLTLGAAPVTTPASASSHGSSER
ncbi:MAG: tetratricopeptide repeat protein [Gammaproteobacteria bacterium]